MNDTAGTPAPSSSASGRSPSSGIRALPPWAPQAALGAVLVLAAVLYGWGLGSLGWGNTYYSAAVKSMGTSWTNFLFGSFDTAGVITVDKPPAALWPQVISSKIFGLHGWALILPELIAGVMAVLVLHRTVRRWAGEGAGLLAAVVLALTPITVAINRDNNPDTLLVLLLVTAAYALTRALRATRSSSRAATWWLCASGLLIGCGFLTKMLAAWMVIPAFAAAWLVGAAGTWAARLGRLPAAGAVLAAASLWWIAMVDLWPGDHPYIGGSRDGSSWDLVVGYNGLGRVFGENTGAGGGSSPMGSGLSFGGAPGLGRLFNDIVAGQISWLLPTCAVALAVAVAGAVLRRRGALPASAVLPASGWVLWGTWLVVCAAVFSTQKGIFHPYYTTQLAPAIAALCGGLLAALVRAHRAGARWVTPVAAAAVGLTVLWAAVVILRSPDWNSWLVWPVVVAGCATVALLLASRRRGRLLPTALVGAVASVLLAPGVWAARVPGSSATGANPTAGPAVSPFTGQGGMLNGLPGFPGGGSGGSGSGGDRPSRMPSGMPTDMPGFPGGGSGSTGSGGDRPSRMPSGMPTDMPGFPGGGSGGTRLGLLGGESFTGDQRRILDYAVQHAPTAQIKLAMEGGALSSASAILHSDETVIGMGGFMGSDNAPSVRQLTAWTKSGELRFILGSGPAGGMGAMISGQGKDNPATQRSEWIGEHCTKVPASAYRGGSGGRGSGAGGTAQQGVGALYDCAPRGR